jgi:hypothetical protein
MVVTLPGAKPKITFHPVLPAPAVQGAVALDVLLKLNTTVLAWPNKEPAVMVPLPLFVLPKSMVLLVAVLVPPAVSAMFKIQVVGLIWPVISTMPVSLVTWACADNCSKAPQTASKAVL